MIPTSMATFLLSSPIHLFCGIFYFSLWHFNDTFGSSRITNPAYQHWPTCDL